MSVKNVTRISPESLSYASRAPSATTSRSTLKSFPSPRALVNVRIDDLFVTRHYASTSRPSPTRMNQPFVR